MNRIAAVVAGLSLAFLGTSATIADTINVPGDYALIQDAIDASSDGDTIQIAPGTYIEKILKNNGKSLAIVGTREADGSLVTTIEAQGTCAGSNCGGGSWGDHIFDLDTPDGVVVIKDLVLTEGYASYGGAVHFKGGSLTIEGCDLINNVSRTNGVIARVNAPSESGQLLINNCTFDNNTSGSSQDYATEAYYQTDQHPFDVTMRDLTLSNGAGMGRIDTAGAILIERCAVSGADPYDSPDESGDPILESWNASSVTITDSSFEDNINGGAIYLRNCGPVAISDSTIRFNTQMYEWWNGPGVGGGIALWNCGG